MRWRQVKAFLKRQPAAYLFNFMMSCQFTILCKKLINYD